MKKILFICGVLPSDDFNISSNSKNYMQFAAEKFQRNIIDGYIQNGYDIDILSAPFIGPFPKNYKKIFYKPNTSSKTFVGFNNIWGVRNYSRYNSLKKQINKINLLEYDHILIYSLHTPFVKLAKYIKTKCNIKISLVVPDLPQYMNLNDKKSFIYTFFKGIDIKLLDKCIKYIDCFVLLTEQMNQFVNKNNKKYIVCEGIINDKDILYNNTFKESDKKRIVYTGTTNIQFGIKTLIDAFLLIDDENTELHICGTGDGTDYILDKAKYNQRIKYHGILPLQKSIELQNSATILINPRKNDSEYTKYSFPSKTMEYLSKMKPVLCFKLDGIPHEYDNVLFYFEDDSLISVKNKMIETLNLDNEALIALRNKIKTFIDSKTCKVMISKIINMINDDLS